jgi:selenide,water dikinase
LELYFDQIPLITPARKYADAYTFPGGASDNKLWFGSWVSFDPALNESDQMLLFDPQTSGGLLLCVPEDCLTAFLEKAKERDIPVWEIGKVTSQLGLRVHKVF